MKFKEIYIRWIGIPIVAIFAMLANEIHENISLWMNYLISVMFTAVYWNGACFIIFYFRRRFPEISKVQRRLALSAAFIILWMTVGGIPIKLLMGDTSLEDLLKMKEYLPYLPFNFIAAIIVSLTYEASYFFEKWKEQFRINEQLKNQQIKTQYEVLQNQMSPHFLFNSLNTLASIIPEDSNAAVSFTEKLSEVYRYILNNKQRELVSLDEELSFVKSYLFLLRMRYPDNLTFSFMIEKKFHDMTIPPLTLQMLVENAIKHNIVSKTKPLHIDIYIENGRSVIVKNNLQKKETADISTKTGLDNIRKRYKILGNKEIDVITSTTNFMVAVPLIDLLEEKDMSLV